MGLEIDHFNDEQDKPMRGSSYVLRKTLQRTNPPCLILQAL